MRRHWPKPECCLSHLRPESSIRELPSDGGMNHKISDCIGVLPGGYSACSSGSAFLQRGSPPPPPWRLSLGHFFPPHRRTGSSRCEICVSNPAILILTEHRFVIGLTPSKRTPFSMSSRQKPAASRRSTTKMRIAVSNHPRLRQISCCRIVKSGLTIRLKEPLMRNGYPKVHSKHLAGVTSVLD